MVFWWSMIVWWLCIVYSILDVLYIFLKCSSRFSNVYFIAIHPVVSIPVYFATFALYGCVVFGDTSMFLMFLVYCNEEYIGEFTRIFVERYKEHLNVT